MRDLDLLGLLRRIRRVADLSQRELAQKGGSSRATIAAAEAGTRGLDARHLARLAAVAGLRLALVDGDGAEIAPMDGAAVRDEGGRRFPAHLDTRHGDEGWWHDPHHVGREPVEYTFDRDRRRRDRVRAVRGAPADHHVPGPGDSLAERAATRRTAARRARAEENARRLAAQVGQPFDDGFSCECPPACDEFLLAEDPPRPGERPRHAADCPCGCDVG